MKTYTLTEKVQNFAILSRAVILSLQIVSNLIIPDHEADAFISPADPKLSRRFGDVVTDFLFKAFIRWDAQYFIHIAEYGYTHENTLAFFPLFPMLVRAIGTVLNIPLQFFCNYHSSLIIAAVLLNFILFIKTVVIFFKLSKEVLQSESLAYKSALLFCVNPASIFFSAPYSETLFSFLIFSALLVSENRSSFMCPVKFGLAGAARANGLVNIGFLLYHKLQGAAAYFCKIRNATTESGKLSLIVVIILTFNYTLIPLTIGCFIVILPFGLFQIWCYYVGAFKYYELKQVPNFVLALPIVMSVICHAALYMVDNPEIILSLGVPPMSIKSRKDHKLTAWCNNGINSWRIFVYTAHSLVLCIFCVLCIHVQVTTRLLCSSSPIVYWFAASLLSDSYGAESSPKQSRHNEFRAESLVNMNKRFKVNLFEMPRNFWGQIILCYYIFYFVVGTILFSNFFPWT